MPVPIPLRRALFAILLACLAALAVSCRGSVQRLEEEAAIAKAEALEAETEEGFTASEQTLERLVDRDPDNDRILAHLGTVLKHHMEKFLKLPDDRRIALERRAVEVCTRALALNPKNVEAQRALAWTYEHSETDRPRCVDAYRRLVELAPNDEWARFNSGRCIRALGRTDEAINAFRRLHEAAYDPKLRSLSLMEIGQMQMELGRNEESEATLKRSVSEMENIDDVGELPTGCPHQALGELYGTTGRTDEMEQMLLRAAEIDPNKPGTQLDSALIAFSAGDYERTREYVDRAIKLRNAPRDKVVKGLLLLFQKKYDDAEALFRAAIAQRPGSLGATVGLAHLDIIRHDLDGAKDRLQPVATMCKTALDASMEWGNVPMRYRRFVCRFTELGLGWAAANGTHHEQAITHFDRILKSDPDDPLAMVAKGTSLIWLKRFDEAETILNRTIELYPGSPYARAGLGLIYLNRGDDKQAETAFNKALSLEGQKYTCPYEGLGLLYLRQGRVEDAKKNFERAIEINPNIEYRKFNELARIYIDEGRYDEAEQLLRKSMENFPQSHEAEAVLAELQARRAAEAP